jgi:hypothetical protein
MGSCVLLEKSGNLLSLGLVQIDYGLSYALWCHGHGASLSGTVRRSLALYSVLHVHFLNCGSCSVLVPVDWPLPSTESAFKFVLNPYPSANDQDNKD